MAKQKHNQSQDIVLYEKRCKVCNSNFRNLIEQLHIQGMNPRQIIEYLKALTDPLEIEQLAKDDLTESTIRRHLDKHFDVRTGAMAKIAETKTRLQQSREDFKNGVQVMVDSVGTLNYLIEVALISLEDLDNMSDGRQRHQAMLNSMTTIKGLIESLAKLTGELKQEGTIDINFFSDQITRFADIVHSTVRELDKRMGLNNRLEYAFSSEFKNQWEAYQLRQNRIVNGELSTNDGSEEKNINTFNDQSEL